MQSPTREELPLCEQEHAMTSLRDMWSTLNKESFLNLFFEGWDRSDPSEYYHNKWLLFRNSPLQFWCSCDDDKRTILHNQLYGLTRKRKTQTKLPFTTDEVF